MSLVFLSLACLPAALAAVFELPIRIQDTYSMVEVQVGTPPVSHSLLFDTGSASTWMFTSDCLAGTSCPNFSGYERAGYDAAASSSSEDIGSYAVIEYLGGTTSGHGTEDVYALPSARNATWKQTFIAANDSTWSNIPADGFLGLAFSTIADGNTTTMVETMMQRGLLDEPRFGLYYGTELSNTNGTGDGTLTFGGSHEDVFVEGEMQWTGLAVPADNAQLWRVDMNYLVGRNPGDTGGTVTLSGTWGIFDTGAGRIGVPDSKVEEIYTSIGMNWTAILAGDVIPLCEDFTDEWSVELNIGNYLNPTTLVLTGEDLKKPGFASGEAKYCWPPFDASGNDGLFLFGTDFMKKFYTVWDFGGSTPLEYNARFGFGELKEEYQPAPFSGAV